MKNFLALPRPAVCLIWLATLFFSSHSMAMSEKDFVSLLDGQGAKIGVRFDNPDPQIRLDVARYTLVQSFVVLNQKFSQLGCDPLLDYSAKKRIFKDGIVEAMPWVTKYLAYYRGRIISDGVDVSKLDYEVQQIYEQLKCD